MKVLFVLLGLIALFFFFPLLGVLIGAFCGWVVGLFWPNAFALWLSTLGMSAFAPWQVGAGLGFIGGFFKSIVNKG